MKTLIKAVFIFVVLLSTGIIIQQTGKSHDTKDPQITKETTQKSEELCFIWNTEAGDSASLKFSVSGEDVAGSFKWLPKEKDSKTGTFSGKITSGSKETMVSLINGWWETSAEGMTATEEIEIIFGGGIANVGFGEMKDRGDGRYVYADPAQISWEPNLSQTDCSDEALR